MFAESDKYSLLVVSTFHSQSYQHKRLFLSNVDATGRYEYKVQAITHEGVAGPFSPPLIYEARRGFCGDGKIDEGTVCRAARLGGVWLGQS